MKKSPLAVLCCLICLLAAPGRAAGEETRTVLFPLRQAVLSSRIESVIVKHQFRDGETFARGAVLTSFDRRAAKEKLARAQSTERESRASLAFAKRSLEIATDLNKKGMQGQQELERAILEVEVSAARLQAAEALLRIAEQELADCEIRAPFDGRVVRRLAQEYEFVRVGQQVLQVIDDHELLAVLHLNSELRNQVKLGETRSIKVDETGTVHAGPIVEISGDIDAGSRTFEIKVKLANADRKLTAGMSGVLVKNQDRP